MTLPQLEKFINDPGYLDHGSYGRLRFNKYKYKERYDTIRKTFKEFPVTYYIDSPLSYYVKVTVPSEIRGNTYDVVFHFVTNINQHIESSFITNYFIEVFSNNPVFAFHFGYANNKAEIIIPALLSKISKDILLNKSEKYNPHSDIGYDHSLYMAGRYLLSQSKFLNKGYIESRAKPYKPLLLFSEVRSIDQTITEYKSIKDRDKLKSNLNREKSLSNKLTDVKDEIKSKFDKLKDAVTIKQPKRFVGSANSKSGVSYSKKITRKSKIGPKK